MAEQDIQKRIDFILEQQAQLTADLQRLAEAQVNFETRLGSAEARIGNLEGAMVGLVNLFGEVVKAHKNTDATVSDLVGKAEGLAGQVSTLAERMETFMSTIRNYFSERNGGGKKWN